MQNSKGGSVESRTVERKGLYLDSERIGVRDRWQNVYVEILISFLFFFALETGKEVPKFPVLNQPHLKSQLIFHLPPPFDGKLSAVF